MKIDVGIISHKPGPLLDRCITGLIEKEAGIKYNLLLQISEGTVTQNWNRLIDRCKGDFICILEDDTVPIHNYWLRNMVDTMTLYEECAIVMPIETKDGTYADPGFTKWMNKQSIVTETYGFCNLIRRDVGLRADENLTYFHDIDLSNQAIAKGHICICNGFVMMQHGGPDRMSNAPDIMTKQSKDKDYLAAKWRVKK